MQKQHRTPNPSKPAYGNILSPDDHSDIAAAFSESCRLDNSAPDFSTSAQVQQQSSIGNAAHHTFYGANSSNTMHNMSQSPAQPKNMAHPILHLNHGNILTSTSSSSCSSISSAPSTAQSPSNSIQMPLLANRSDINMHQKLQRQLSLNPYDPRMIRMHHTNSLHTKHSMSEQRAAELTQVMQRTGHRQLAPSLSGGPQSHMTNHWDLHQVRSVAFKFFFPLFNYFFFFLLFFLLIETKNRMLHELHRRPIRREHGKIMAANQHKSHTMTFYRHGLKRIQWLCQHRTHNQPLPHKPIDCTYNIIYLVSFRKIKYWLLCKCIPLKRIRKIFALQYWICFRKFK